MYCTEGTYEAKSLPISVVMSANIVYRTIYNIEANPPRI